MSLKVNADSLSKTVMDMLDGYSDDIASGVADAIVMVGKQTVKNLKDRSPKLTGDYRKGWSMKKESSRWKRYRINRVIVHNKTDYQLIHLLENGHQAKYGGRIVGRVEGKPHVQPAYDDAMKMIEEEVKKVIEEAGS